MKKKESGHAGRKRRAAAAQRALQEQGERAQSGELKAGLERLAAIGPPPEDTKALLPWTAAIVAEVLHQTATDPHLDEDRRRAQVASLADKLGKLHPRAQIEQTVRQLQQALHVRQDYSDVVKIVPGSSVAKSPNARGARPRGPRPIPPDAVVDDKPSGPRLADDVTQPPKEDPR
jgi:hypothetical protein